jgi:hypothetical protein
MTKESRILQNLMSVRIMYIMLNDADYDFLTLDGLNKIIGTNYPLHLFRLLSRLNRLPESGSLSRPGLKIASVWLSVVICVFARIKALSSLRILTGHPFCPGTTPDILHR